MQKPTTLLRAIRAKCLDCCGGNSNEVKLCPCIDCPLYEFRFGRNPYHKIVKGQKAEFIEHMTSQKKKLLRRRK